MLMNAFTTIEGNHFHIFRHHGEEWIVPFEPGIQRIKFPDHDEIYFVVDWIDPNWSGEGVPPIVTRRPNFWDGFSTACIYHAMRRWDFKPKMPTFVVQPK